MSRMEKAIALFDAYNQRDPHIITQEGISYPAEYFYSLQLWHWVKRLQPDAGEVLLLASRCQHIGRWEIPRSEYPAGKAGYYSWRTGLAKFHADKAGELMKEAGYDAGRTKGDGYGMTEKTDYDAGMKAGHDAGIVDAVRSILLKENLRTSPDMQVMENALCLVFLQFQYEDFEKTQEEEKMIRILKKTWTKMSQPGRDAAMGLVFSERGKELIGKALAGQDS